MTKLGECCETMKEAIRWGFIEIDPETKREIIFTRRELSEVAPQAKVGNVLTGETYNPSRFQMSLALPFCPWCMQILKGEDP